MSDHRYVKPYNFGLVGLAFTSVVICWTYSGSLTSLHSKSKYGVMQKSANWKNTDHKMSNIIDNCELKWKNSKVNTTAYENVYDITAIHRKNYFTLPKPVESLYPDPVIRLNPDKFLLPVLCNGPNNQLTGLREATFVAIKLNRTLVLPRFFKHFSDSSVTSLVPSYIYPGHRIDIEKYCKFVSCVTIEQFREACGRQLEAMMYLRRGVKKSEIRSWESYSGMRFQSRVKGQDSESNPEGLNVNFIPDSAISGITKFRKFKLGDVKNVLESKARCVLYPKSLYNLDIEKPDNGIRKDDGLELIRKQEDIGKMTDFQLFLSVSEASGSPEYIKNMAKDFVSAKIKNRAFVSVHWRYNKKDFMTRCRDVTDDEFRKQLCKKAMRIKPGHIAQAIEKKMADLKAKGFNIRDVYIASPPSERTVVARVAELLYDNHGWLTYSSLDLNEFMHTSYKSCDILKLHFDDIVSTTEMEICGLGTAFLGSARSTWSESVNLARITSYDKGILSQLDEDIFTLSTANM